MDSDILLCYLYTFESEHGRRVLEHLRAAFYDRPMFDYGQTRSLDLAFQEGRRSVVLEILEAIEEGRRVKMGLEQGGEYDGRNPEP